MTEGSDIARRVEEYHAWLRQKTALRSLAAGWTEITTPFLNRRNDHIQIFARQDRDSFELNDDGETLRDLEMSGCAIDTPRRREMLRSTLSGFGVGIDNGVIGTHATIRDFPWRKHGLVQAIAAVNDIFYTASASTPSFFRDDVAAWLKAEDIRAVPDVQFTGRSGFQHRFDYAVPASRTAPERLLRSINQPSRDAATSLIMAWNDTHEVRGPDARAVAVLNDTEAQVSPAVTQALREYGIDRLLWSQRSAARGALAA